MANATTAAPALRPLRRIAADILRDPKLAGNARAWATPYLRALLTVDTAAEYYGCDSAESCILYALGNLQGWRGDAARTLKAELKSHLPKRSDR